MVWRHCARLMSTSRAWVRIPAEFTSTSIGPAASAMAAADASSVTSTCRSAPRRSAVTTALSSARNASAIAAPIPLPPPTTSTTAREPRGVHDGIRTVRPPSTTIAWPVRYDARGLQRKVTTSAISSGRPTRPSGDAGAGGG